MTLGNCQGGEIAIKKNRTRAQGRDLGNEAANEGRTRGRFLGTNGKRE